MAPLSKGWWYRRHICYGYVAVWMVLAGLAPCGSIAAAKFAGPAVLHIDADATIALPRTWGPLRLTSESPIPTVTQTTSSPFGPSRLVFAQQASPSEGFGLVTVRKVNFDKGTPQYLETLPPRHLAILLSHMESRVHGDRPAWAVRLVHGKPPMQRLLGERRVIYWEGEWHTSNNRTAMVRGYAFFCNGAVYLLRVISASGLGRPKFVEEARFADAVAATFRTK